ncbi:MAG TPA: hypothetical protein VFU53_04965, partial [Burkholderiales bacterium]|nr:hypothetical protein [Burkholderiales bacterium]
MLPADVAAAQAAGYDSSRVFSGGAGDDTIIGGALDDRIAGGEANDILWGGRGDDELDGNDGTGDRAIYEGERDEFHLTRDAGSIRVSDLDPGLDEGSDNLTDIELIEFLVGGGVANLISGTDGDERILGTTTFDYLFASPGDHIIEADDGDDVVIWSPGDGDDMVKGGLGSDELQLNLPADAAGTVAVTPNADGSVTVTGTVTETGDFELTLFDVELLSILGPDGELADEYWLEQMFQAAEDGSANDQVILTPEDFSEPQVGPAFDQVAPDADPDFLI